MKVLLLGASGMIGSRIAAELESRRHEVVAGVRPGKTDGAVIDPRQATSIASVSLGMDAVISALGRGTTGETRVAADVARPLLAGLDQAGCFRLLVVGGAGSLRVDGARVIDRPSFPEAFKAGSQAQIDALEIYRAYEGPVVWSYLSPSDRIAPGERTGELVLGQDDLLTDDDGSSFVSAEDYAIAMVDELESGAHPRERFTVRSAKRPSQLSDNA